MLSHSVILVVKQAIESQGIAFTSVVRHFQTAQIKAMQDDFAGMAMQAILSRPNAGELDFCDVARESYEMAEEMILARDAQAKAKAIKES